MIKISPPPPRKKLEELIPIWRKELKIIGINADSLSISIGTHCSVSARIINGKIEVCQKILGYQLKDQISILWHEIYHLNNDKPWDKMVFKLNNPIIIGNIPIHIQNYINNVLNGDFRNYPDGIHHHLYMAEITFTQILSPEYYINEIAAYLAEIAVMMNVTPEYQAERGYLLWRYREALKISEKYYRK